MNGGGTGARRDATGEPLGRRFVARAAA